MIIITIKYLINFSIVNSPHEDFGWISDEL